MLKISYGADFFYIASEMISTFRETCVQTPFRTLIFGLLPPLGPPCLIQKNLIPLLKNSSPASENSKISFPILNLGRERHYASVIPLVRWSVFKYLRDHPLVFTNFGPRFYPMGSIVIAHVSPSVSPSVGPLVSL